MAFNLREYILFRTEINRELFNSEVDTNFKMVANPWANNRVYEEGNIVYHPVEVESSTGITGPITSSTGSETQSLVWWRANKRTTLGVFNTDEWDLIGGIGTGDITIKSSPGFGRAIINYTGPVSWQAGNDALLSASTPNAAINLVAGNGISLQHDQSTNSIKFINTGSLGEINLGINIGNGLPVFAGMIDTDLTFKGLGVSTTSSLALSISTDAFNNIVYHLDEELINLSNLNGGQPKANMLADIRYINGGPTNNDILQWNASSNEWLNVPLNQSGGQGAQGVQGIQGIQGIQGVQGTQGIQGIQGLAGQGGNGTQGIQGVQGVQGIQGVQGLAGQDGDGTAYYGQVSRITPGTVTGITTGVYKSTGLTATLDSEAYGVGLGTTDGFAVKNISGEPILVEIYGSADIASDNNEILGIKLALNDTPIDNTECRAQTGLGSGNFAKLITNWMITLQPNDEVALYVTNHTTTTNLVIQRGRLVATSVGRQGFQGLQGTTGTQGVQGLLGLQGTQGIAGTDGLTCNSFTVNNTSPIATGTVNYIDCANQSQSQELQPMGTIDICAISADTDDVNIIIALTGVCAGSDGVQGIQGVQGTQGTQGIIGATGPQCLSYENDGLPDRPVILVNMPDSLTYYIAAEVTLDAGTWLLNGHITVGLNHSSPTDTSFFARILVDSNPQVIAASAATSTESSTAIRANMAMTTIITLSATTIVKLQATWFDGVGVKFITEDDSNLTAVRICD